MFTLARADAGTYPVRMQPMYLDEVIDEVVAAARVIAATRNVTITVDVAHSAAYVGDEELIRRLAANLVDNAVRHSPDGTAVSVRLRADDGGYSLEVADRGSGIPPEHQPHVFERFYRVEASRVRGGSDGGAGLGLSLARWVARVHSGDITLQTSSSEGSTFSVFLPSGG
jgi:signal transduction histidine kinase